MTKLKLVVNNSFSDFKKNEIFFNRQELKIILNLYAKMVSQGYWKDYSFNISKKRISFLLTRGYLRMLFLRSVKIFMLKTII